MHRHTQAPHPIPPRSHAERGAIEQDQRLLTPTHCGVDRHTIAANGLKLMGMAKLSGRQADRCAVATHGNALYVPRSVCHPVFPANVQTNIEKPTADGCTHAFRIPMLSPSRSRAARECGDQILTVQIGDLSGAGTASPCDPLGSGAVGRGRWRTRSKH